MKSHGTDQLPNEVLSFYLGVRKVMSEEEDLKEVLRARIVADALTGGDVDALIELSDVLEASGTPDKIRTFVLQLLFELLPDTARDAMAAAAEAGGHSNVIDFFTREPRD